VEVFINGPSHGKMNHKPNYLTVNASIFFQLIGLEKLKENLA
jgi:hypothetical protein